MGGEFDHRCAMGSCLFLGQLTGVTSRPCGCHQTREQMMLAEIARLRATAQAPFSTYPEDRTKMLSLCADIENNWGTDKLETPAVDLADLVKAILDDEAIAFKMPEWPTYEERCIDVERNRIEREKIQMRCECGCVTSDAKCVIGNPKLCSNNP